MKLNLQTVYHLATSMNYANFVQNLQVKFLNIPITEKSNISNRLFLTLQPEKRNIHQNKLYWLWLTCLEAETGNDKNDLHEFFKDKFLKKELIEVFETQILKEVSTAKLDKKQFSAYLEKIQIFAQTELEIKLPEPKDKEFEQFYEFYKDKI